MPLRNPGTEPSTAATIRLSARRDYVQQLRSMLAPWGFLGFLDAAACAGSSVTAPTATATSSSTQPRRALQAALGDRAAKPRVALQQPTSTAPLTRCRCRWRGRRPEHVGSGPPCHSRRVAG